MTNIDNLSCILRGPPGHELRMESGAARWLYRGCSLGYVDGAPRFAVWRLLADAPAFRGRSVACAEWRGTPAWDAFERELRALRWAAGDGWAAAARAHGRSRAAVFVRGAPEANALSAYAKPGGAWVASRSVAWALAVPPLCCSGGDRPLCHAGGGQQVVDGNIAELAHTFANKLAKQKDVAALGDALAAAGDVQWGGRVAERVCAVERDIAAWLDATAPPPAAPAVSAVPAAPPAAPAAPAAPVVPPAEPTTRRERNTLLYRAARGGDAAAVARLVRADVAVDCVVADGTTPLHAACRNGHALCAASLLNACARPNARAGDGRTPLIAACAGDHEACVRLLLNRGANCRLVADDGRAPLHFAADRGALAAAAALLEAGADADVRNAYNRTPLHVACWHGRGGMVSLLLDRGADPTAEDADGRTPEDLARANYEKAAAARAAAARAAAP